MKKVILILVTVIWMVNVSRGDSWTQKAYFPNGARAAGASFSIDSIGYFGTGVDENSNYYTDLWAYDPSNNSWTQLAGFVGPTIPYYYGFSIDSFGYFINPVSHVMYQYNPNSNSWIQKTSFPGLSRFDCIIFTIGNKAFFGSGDGNGIGIYYKDFWEYDPSNDSWTQKADFGGGYRMCTFSISIGNKGYAGGGCYRDTNSLNSTYFNDFWEYDTTLNNWTQKANFGGGYRISAVGFSINNLGYIGTGSDSNINNFTTDFWEYNPSIDIWTQKASFDSIGRNQTVAFHIGNKGYIGTGIYSYNSTNYLNDFWEYDPNGNAGIQSLYQPPLQTSLYPNPFTDKTTLTIAGNHQNTMLNIFNIQGQKVKSLFIGNATEMVIDRDDLSEGIYFYELIDSNSKPIATGKMVVE